VASPLPAIESLIQGAVALVFIHAVANPSATTIALVANIITSLPFILIGMVGLARLNLGRTKQLPATALVFLISLIFVGAGSTFYHWSPSPERLLWDRLPIAICLAAFACMLANLNGGSKIGTIFLCPAMILSVGSVLYWYATWKWGHEDLRAYAAIQVGVILYAVWIAFGSSLQPHALFSLRLGLAVYAVGRVAEVFQQQLYQIVGVDLGHPLKHLLVALATYFMVRSYEFSIRKELRSSAESSSAAIPLPN